MALTTVLITNKKKKNYLTYSRSAPQLVNSNDGRNIDRSSEIAEKKKNIMGIEKCPFPDHQHICPPEPRTFEETL